MQEKILHKELSYRICGLCFKTHNELGAFRSEKTYCDYLEELFTAHNISFQRESAIPINFEVEMKCRNIPDFIIEDKIILDLKAKKMITKEDYFQMKRYLVAANKDLGIIINFRQRYLSPKRILNS